MEELSANSAMIAVLWVLWLAWQFWTLEEGFKAQNSSRSAVSSARGDDHARSCPHGALTQISAVNSARILPALRRVYAADRSFTLMSFLSEASRTFEEVLLAFWRNDKKRLFSTAIADQVFEDLADAISQRTDRRERSEIMIVRLFLPYVVDAHIEQTKVHLSVRLQAELISTNRDENGAVIAGHPSEIWRSSDVWTFARTLPTVDEVWRVELIGADIEDIKQVPIRTHDNAA
ncbi:MULTISPECIES: Tim44/TimA family putative adaptor protein [unclassified Sinorhizobium]|uniref:Tim44/TimA family putative adaptor protein n=1 Tax=unclassified Sinorhizobium TaxID=2613772 RepID=UPI003523EDD6